MFEDHDDFLWIKHVDGGELKQCHANPKFFPQTDKP
jgi:hypothetical protein